MCGRFYSVTEETAGRTRSINQGRSLSDGGDAIYVDTQLHGGVDTMAPASRQLVTELSILLLNHGLVWFRRLPL